MAAKSKPKKGSVAKKAAKPAKKVIASKSKATSKSAPKKAGKAKPAAKKTVSKAKPAAKPVKKAAAKPAKKAPAKPVKKQAAKPAKKAPAKPAKKQAAKPVKKAAAKPAKKTAKKTVKPVAKKAAAPAKKAPAKAAAKSKTPAKPVKKVAKAAPAPKAKTAAKAKPAPKAPSKKEAAKPEPKAANKKETAKAAPAKKEKAPKKALAPAPKAGKKAPKKDKEDFIDEEELIELPIADDEIPDALEDDKDTDLILKPKASRKGKKGKKDYREVDGKKIISFVGDRRLKPVNPPAPEPDPVPIEEKLLKGKNGKLRFHKLEMEFPIHASKPLLYSMISTPAGLSEWFADDVNIRGNVFTFFWEGSSQTAELKVARDQHYVRFHWLDSPEGTFFEMRIEVDDLTNDVALLITDYLEDASSADSSRMIWESQVEKLLRAVGGY